jgi:hypothetical protein
MRRELRNKGAVEGLREERAALVHRYTVAGPGGDEGSREVVAKSAETGPASPRIRRATDYLIEVELVGRFLWRWFLFELIEIRGDGTLPPLPGRSPEPVAKSGALCWSRRAAIRAAESEARALSLPATEAVPAGQPPTASRSPRSSKLIVALFLVLLAAALVAGTIIATRGDSHRASTSPLTPPAKTRSVGRPRRRPISARRAAQLNKEGYSRMRGGDYAAALPLLERAVGGLRRGGSLNEAYAEFNLAYTRYHLGKCGGVIALLDRSQRIQGRRAAIDNLRADAQRNCR